MAGPALPTSKYPPGRLQEASRMEGGGILAPWPRAHSRTHLGRRLPEQRSVIRAAGPVGPGSKVLHFRAASLVPSRSKASPHQLAKSGRPPLTAHAWPGPWEWKGGEGGKSRRGDCHSRGPRPLRPSPAVLISSGRRGKRKETNSAWPPPRPRPPPPISAGAPRGESLPGTSPPRGGAAGVKLRAGRPRTPP